MNQRFYADSKHAITSANGAIGYASGSMFDCLGHYAKITNCPIDSTGIRLTCYATGYADTFFSIPACTRRKGVYVTGFFASSESGPKFIPHSRFNYLF